MQKSRGLRDQVSLCLLEHLRIDASGDFVQRANADTGALRVGSRQKSNLVGIAPHMRGSIGVKWHSVLMNFLQGNQCPVRIPAKIGVSPLGNAMFCFETDARRLLDERIQNLLPLS